MDHVFMTQEAQDASTEARKRRDAHERMAAVLRVVIGEAKLVTDSAMRHFITSALGGYYQHSSPVSPEYIGLTYEQFTALRVLVYGDTIHIR